MGPLFVTYLGTTSHLGSRHTVSLHGFYVISYEMYGLHKVSLDVIAFRKLLCLYSLALFKSECTTSECM